MTRSLTSRNDLAVLAAAVQGSTQLREPVWFGYASVLLVLVVTIAGVWLLVRLVRWDPGDDDGGGGGGGGGGGDTPPPRAPLPDGEPDWWPEFERAFADHVNALMRGSVERDRLH